MSRRKTRKESSVIQAQPEVIKIQSSDEGNGTEKGGSSTPSHTGGQGARARYHHQQRVDQIFEEEGRTELLQAYRQAPLTGGTGEVSQIEGASPSAQSRPPVRKPRTVPEVLKGTVHDKPAEELVMVSMSEEQEQTESRAVTASPSQETVVVSTPSTLDTTITPQGLVLSDLETATTPTLTIRGDHVHISPSEPEGSLVREMASTAAGSSSRQHSPVVGEEGNTQGDPDQAEMIDVEGELDGSRHSEITLNPRGALERAARERGIQTRRSFRRRQLYQAVVQLHRLSERSIRNWTRRRDDAEVDPSVTSPIGPDQVQRVRRPIRHPTQAASPGLRRVPSCMKGSLADK